jgi:hypothetical protein
MLLKRKKSDSKRAKHPKKVEPGKKSVLTLREAREQLAKLSRTAKVGDLLSSTSEDWNIDPDSINHKG